MDLGLRGRVAVVAASSQGLGKACALELAREGAKVVICARANARLAKTANEIQSTVATEVLAIKADLTDAAQIRHLADQAFHCYGRIDVLVTNNGGPPAGYFDEFDDDVWLMAHQLTLLSSVRLIRAVLPAMRAQLWGRIINIAAASVKQPIDSFLLSAVYRLGVVGLTKALSAQFAAKGITVNNVAPGFIQTDRVGDVAKALATEQGKNVDEFLAGVTASIPMNRLGEPEELAALVAFLASERAGYITGATIQVDGGYVRAIL